MNVALTYGIFSALFFSLTFILNRSMHLDGGYWLWSAILRYVYMLPVLWFVLYRRKQVQSAYAATKTHKSFWLLWSTVGFGLFYAPLTLAAAYGSSWLIAATWQITIVAGVLLSPLFGQKIPLRTLAISCMIVTGVFIMQIKNMHYDNRAMLMTIIPMLVAAFAYPLGNRKTMQRCPASMNALQRVFIMTLYSMPFWGLCAVYAFFQSGFPSFEQHILSFVVALSSGVIATYLFFAATEMVKNNAKQLAVVEATQSGEVIFTFLGGILFLGDALPNYMELYGVALIVLGMVIHSVTAKTR